MLRVVENDRRDQVILGSESPAAENSPPREEMIDGETGRRREITSQRERPGDPETGGRTGLLHFMK